MACEGNGRLLQGYFDGELDLIRTVEFEEHLKTCPDCVVLVQQTRLTINLYYDSDLVDYPVEIRARLHETLRRKICKDPN